MTQEPPGSATCGHAQPAAEAIPRYSATTTANEVSNQVNDAYIPSQGGVETPSLGHESSSTSPSKGCGCIVCLEIGIIRSRDNHFCHLANCNWEYEFSSHSSDRWVRKRRASHERTHYQGDPKTSQTPFFCPIDDCRFTSKRWPDLQRHTSAKHCNNPAKFVCSVIGCKYNGEGNGFTRKDKLMAHHKSMHQGQKIHGQPVRTIKPAPASSYAEASASSSFAAQGS